MKVLIWPLRSQLAWTFFTWSEAGINISRMITLKGISLFETHSKFKGQKSISEAYFVDNRIVWCGDDPIKPIYFYLHITNYSIYNHG